MFIFKKIEAQNFMSIGSMELNLENQGLVLIEGKNDSDVTFESNGSGKTSIISAITYALYGQTTYGIKADDVINRHFGKNMIVKLDFEVDGVPHVIERYRKHSKHKNKVILIKEGKDISGKSAKETEEMVLGLFGIDYQTYMNSIVQGQGNSEVFTKATDKGKKEILENITNIAIYKKAQDIAKAKVAEQDLSHKEVVANIESLNKELEYLGKLEETDRENYSHTVKLIKEASNELARLELAYDRAKNEEFEEWVVTELNKHEGMEKPMANFDLSQEEIDLKAKIEKTKQGGTDITFRIQTMTTDINNKRNQQRQLDTQTECSLCGAPLDASHAEKEFNRLEEDIKNTQGLSEQISSMYNEQFMPMLKDMEEQLQEMGRAREEAFNENWKNYNEVQEYIQKVVNDDKAYKDEVERTRRAISNAKTNLENFENIPKPISRDEDKQKLTERITQANETLLAVTSKRGKYEDTVKLFSNSGIRSVVLDLVTPYLNERANKYLATLTGSEIEIVFTTQVTNKDKTLSDKFDVQILNANGGDTYKSNSEGEKKRIDLAISFAIQDLVLSKTNMKTNIALYDECFESLDEVGCENVITILKERQEQIGTLFVITHNSHLKTLFEDVITVKKVNGISSIEP